MKLLNGRELAGFIQERQAHQVTVLRQASHVQPKLAILVTVDNPIIDIYVRLKERYGAEINVDVEIHRIAITDVETMLNMLNVDDSVHGIIIQLPLSDPNKTDEIVALVNPLKDVDALGLKPAFDPATPLAILWLLSGYNIDLKAKQVLLIGRGKLVGAPLERMLLASGINVRVADRKTTDLSAETLQADVIITATGQPAILESQMIKQDAVVVDAGVASENGKAVGDVADDVYERYDLTLTPKKGGVGPLTVSALFENVIQAAQRSVQ